MRGRLHGLAPKVARRRRRCRVAPRDVYTGNLGTAVLKCHPLICTTIRRSHLGRRSITTVTRRKGSCPAASVSSSVHRSAAIIFSVDAWQARIAPPGLVHVVNVSARQPVSVEECLWQMWANNAQVAGPLTHRGPRLRQRPRQMRILYDRRHNPTIRRK